MHRYIKKIIKKHFPLSIILRHFNNTSCKKSISIQENIKNKWQSVVGLEIHAQINAKSKLFSDAPTKYGAPTNTQVSYFDAALPGTLPVLNRYCIEAGILTALALNCKVHKLSMFDRKHYFYPDLPAGYQITQQFYPLATDGHINFVVHNKLQGIQPYTCTSRLRQLQLEQDSGKSMHVHNGKTLIDLNRAGIGLIELVFEPDLRNGIEAAMLVKELVTILNRIGTCTCEMEEGALRVDANISVNYIGESFGVRTEVKNINSMKYIAKAIDYEIDRQINILENGGHVSNETRSYDYKSKTTISLRDKEELQDYRYMPEPNLPPIQLCDDNDCNTFEDFDNLINIDTLRRKLPPLPEEDRHMLLNEYKLSYEEADRIVKAELKDVFVVVASSGCNKSYICNFLLNNVQHQLNVKKCAFKDSIITVDKVKDLVESIQNKTISEATANEILDMFFNGDDRSVIEIVKAYNWFLIHQDEELEKLCIEIMATMPKVIKKFRNTKRQKYLSSLVFALNKKVNFRASIKDVEAMFTKLILENKTIIEDKKD